jgi:predicted MFS family arabinose efflux permease
MTARHARLAVLLALSPFAAGYFVSYLFRVVNAAISDDLIAELGLSNTQLGLLTSTYLYGFMLFQLPLGLLLDRFGPRRVQAALMVLAALGALWFALGQSVASLAGARLLIGLGLSGSLMSAFKANAIWLEPSRLALGNSMIFSVGALGFLVGTAPSNWAADALGWRPLFFLLTALTILVAGLIYFCVPRRAEDNPPVAILAQLNGYLGVFKDPTFWRIAPMVASISGTFIAVQSLWATRWMTDALGLDRSQAANQLMIMALAFSIGSLASGFIADRLGRHGIALKHVVAGGFGFFFLTQLAMSLGLAVPLPLIWIMFGLTGQIANLGYASLAEHFGRDLAGRAQSAGNLLLFLMSALFQSGIGWILDRFRDPSGTLDPSGYSWIFAFLLLIQTIVFAIYIRGRYPR